MISFKNKRLMGLIVLVLTGLTLISNIRALKGDGIVMDMGTSDSFYLLYTIISLAGAACIGAPMIHDFKNEHIITAAGFWAFGVSYLFPMFSMFFWGINDSVTSIFSFIFFVGYGYVVIEKFKNAKFGYIFSLAALALTMIKAYFAFGRYSSFSYVNDALPLAIHISFLLMCVSKTDIMIFPVKRSETKEKVSPQTDVKEILISLEAQYRNNEITQEEYNVKRTEIINRLKNQ